MKFFLKLFFLLFLVNISLAQTKKVTPKPTPSTNKSKVKVGYIFEDYILQNYHEVKKLENELDNNKKQYQSEFDKLAQAYQNKYEAYQQSIKNIDSLTTEKLNQKLAEVKESKAKAEEYQRTTEKNLQEQASNGVLVIKNNVAKATNEVAKAQNYQYVFYRNKNDNLMSGRKMVLYCSDKGQNNLSDAILIALGSTPPPAETPKPAAASKSTKPVTKKK